MSLSIVYERINYFDYHFVIVPDVAAGRKGRYTVYRIPASPSRPIKIIGRELTLGHAKRITSQATAKASLRVKREELKYLRAAAKLEKESRKLILTNKGKAVLGNLEDSF